MLEWRNERLLPEGISMSLVMPEARRFTDPCARKARIMKKAIMAVGMKTSASSTRLTCPPDCAAMSSRVSMASDLEVDELVHDQVAHHHPADAHDQDRLGHVEMPDAAVEVGRRD